MSYIAARRRDSKKVALNVAKDDALNMRHFYALNTRGAKSNEDGDDGKSLYLFSVMSSF